MLEYDELKVEFEGYEPELKELAGALDLDNLKAEIVKLEEQSAQPDFWNDVENSQKISQKIGEDKNIVQSYEKLRESYDDVMTMLELAGIVEASPGGFFTRLGTEELTMPPKEE